MLRLYSVIWAYCLLLPCSSVMADTIVNLEIQSGWERAQFFYEFGRNAEESLLDFTLPAPDARLGAIGQQLIYINTSVKRDFGEIAQPVGDYFSWGFGLGINFNMGPVSGRPEGVEFTAGIGSFSATRNLVYRYPFDGSTVMSDTAQYSSSVYPPGYVQSFQTPWGYPGGTIKGITSDGQFASCWSESLWYYSCASPSIDAMKGDKRLVVEVEIGYTYKYDADAQGLLDEASLWLDNLTLASFQKEIRKLIISDDSTHIDQRKNIIIRPAAIGDRASVSFDGVMMTTASPSVLSYDITLPEVSILNLPVSFIANNSDSSIEIYFNEVQLYSGVGDNFVLGELAIIPLDIQQLEGQTGVLKIVLNKVGAESAQLFIPEHVSTEDIVIANYAPVPEPETYVLMLAGLGLVGFAARRRQA